MLCVNYNCVFGWFVKFERGKGRGMVLGIREGVIRLKWLLNKAIRVVLG